MPLPKNIPPLGNSEHTRGPLSAPLVIMSYCNYQCPQSGKAHQAIETLRQTLGEQMCCIYRHFPQPERFPQSQKAAETAECAGSQSKFWEMHDKLYDQQDQLDDGSLVEYADQLGLDIPQFLQEMGQHIHAQRIQINVNSAREYGIEATPTVFFCLRHEGIVNLDPLIQTITDLAKLSPA